MGLLFYHLLALLCLIMFSKLTHSLEEEERLKSQKFNEANKAPKLRISMTK